MSAENFGGGSFAYGPPSAMPDEPYTATPVPTWYPGPVILPTMPRECERCHHLFATVQEWNDHVDACVEKHGARR